MKTTFVLFLLLTVRVAAQTPTITGVSNGVSFAPSVSPGVLATVAGTNFGTDKTLLTCSVGGKPAAVLAATPTALTVQIPYEVTPGATTITVTRSGAASAAFNITVAAYSPGLATASGTTNALITGASGPVTSVKAGDNVSVYAVGLGQTNPPVATGVAAAALSNCVTTPQLTLGGTAITPFFCGIPTGQIGLYQINIQIPANVPPGTQPLVLTIGGVSSPPVNVTVTGGPIVSSVVNAASQDKTAPIAPGSLVIITGAGFGSKDQVTCFPATSAQGVSVTMNGIAAPLVNVLASAGLITVMAPMELPTQGAVPVVVTTADGASTPVQVNMASASPGVFRTGYKKYGAVSLAGAGCGASAGLAASNCGRPLQVGDAVQIYATGLGAATPGGDPAGAPLATGQLTPADGSVLYQAVLAPAVTVGGVPAQVTSSGIVPGLAGEYLVSITVPAGVTPADDVPLVLTLNGLSDTVSIAVGQ